MNDLVIVAWKSPIAKHKRFYQSRGFICIAKLIAAAGTAIAPP